VFKRDNILLGLVPGIVIPLIFGFAFYMITYYSFLSERFEVHEFMAKFKDPLILSPMSAFGCIFNLAFFFLLLKFDKLKAGRGVIVATLLFVVLTIYTKFFA